jgi:hypothetical protein
MCDGNIHNRRDVILGIDDMSALQQQVIARLGASRRRQEKKT